MGRVRHIPGGNLPSRAVVVDLGDRHWRVKTSGRLIRADPCALACISARRLWLRRDMRIALALPGFGGRQTAPLPGTGISTD